MKGYIIGIVLMLVAAVFPITQINSWANGLPPIADAGGPYVSYEGSEIILDASGSYDPDGDLLWYNWDLDGDGKEDFRTWLDTSTFTLIWGDDFYGNITVFVDDGNDGIDVVNDTTTLTVNNVAPDTKLIAEIIEPSIISFYDEASDPGSDDIKFTWDFGDGTLPLIDMYYNDGANPDPYPSPNYNPIEITDTKTHIFQNPGLFTVTVTIEDDDGGVSIDTITIQDGKPIEIIPVFIDIKPGSCPNPIKLKKQGLTPAAILGTDEFDVQDIDPTTIVLSREGYDGLVMPIIKNYEDVATPYLDFCEECDDRNCCHQLREDGNLDFTLKFSTQDIVNTFLKDTVSGDVLCLQIIGNTYDGQTFIGQDVIWIR